MQSTDINVVENLRLDKKAFDIRWRVTSLCNYECDFCIQGKRADHVKQADGESVLLREKISDEIVRMVEEDIHCRSVRIELIGGELTILSDFPSILEKICACAFPGDLNLFITTNFFRDSEYFFNLFDILRRSKKRKKRSLHIFASFYPEYVSEEQYIEKLKKIYDYSHRPHNVFDIVNRLGNKMFLMGGVPIITDEDCDRLIRMKEKLNGTKITLQPIFIRHYKTKVSEENLQKLIHHEGKGAIRVTDVNGEISYFQNIQALGTELEGTDSFCPTGYLCDAGIRNIWVDAFGNVKRCPAIGSTMFLGNILEGNFRLLDKPQICTSDHCSCNQYGRIEKVESAKVPDTH